MMELIARELGICVFLLDWSLQCFMSGQQEASKRITIVSQACPKSHINCSCNPLVRKIGL